MPPKARPEPTDTDIPGAAARLAALRLLDAVLRRGEALDRAAHGATQALKSNAADKALAIAIASESLRWMSDLDRLIDSMTPQILAPDAKVRSVLRLMLAQHFRLQTPPHAIVAATLPLLQGGPRRLAHGVFGNLVRSGAMLPDRPGLPDAAAIRWSAHWGADMVAACEAAMALPPPLDLSLAQPDETADWVATLSDAEQDSAAISLMPGHVRLARDGAITRLPGFDAGAWWVQDIAASLPARLIGRGAPGARALDLCAAPGGKAMQLAAQGWQVTAVDKSRKRLERMADNAERTGQPIDAIAADLLDWAPDAPVPAILLDAPCSATGIFRRHPDVLHRITDRHIAELAALQTRLLDRVASWVAPGGVLVYATCSLERAEGEDQITAFLEANGDFTLDPAGPHLAAAGVPAAFAPSGPGWLRVMPGMLADAGGCDGFFMARLLRKG